MLLAASSEGSRQYQKGLTSGSTVGAVSSTDAAQLLAAFLMAAQKLTVGSVYRPAWELGVLPRRAAQSAADKTAGWCLLDLVQLVRRFSGSAAA